MRKTTLIALLLWQLTSQAQNTALAFNATNKAVLLPSSSSFNLSNQFTIESWLMPVGPGSNATQGGIIISKEGSYDLAVFPDYSLQYAMSANGDGISSWVNTGIVLTRDVWTHVALVKNGTSIQLYLNGDLKYSGTGPATLAPNPQQVRLGSRLNAGHEYNGLMDEVRIWNTARSAVELKKNLFNQNLASSASGLVAYYRFNEGSGTTAANSGTNTTGINGTLINSPVWTSSPVQFSANSLSFNGTSDYATIAHDASLNITSAITLEGWVYATKNSGVQNVLCKSSLSTNNGYIFPRTNDGWSHAHFYLHIGGAWRLLQADFPSLNAWHHLAGTYDGATMKIYINGVLSASQPQTGSITTNTNNLQLGTQPGYGEHFGGRADELRVWNVSRTQAQIQGAMNGEIDPGAQTGLVSYYRFNQGIQTGTNTGLITVPDLKGANPASLTSFSLTGASSNYATQASSLMVLPVSWLFFTAVPVGPTVSLRWGTAREENSLRFVVQHSRNGRDWRVCGSVAAAGTTGGAQTYTFVDASPAEGLNHYRLEQVDRDGHSVFSKVVNVTRVAQKSSLRLVPNLVVNGQLSVLTQEPGSISVYGADGRLYLNKWMMQGSTALDVSSYPKGHYYIKSGNEILPFIIQ